jgi:hypothetical protein
MATRVSVSPMDGGVNVQISGRQLDAQLLQQCLQAAYECADDSGCISEQGITFQPGCAKTIAAHNSSSDCISKALGLT